MIYGYYGSAWATFICYGAMMIVCYLIGQRYFPIQYNLLKFFGYLGAAILLYFVKTIVVIDGAILRFLFHSLLLLIYLGIVLAVEKPKILKINI
jgi:hypothetical protein